MVSCHHHCQSTSGKLGRNTPRAACDLQHHTALVYGPAAHNMWLLQMEKCWKKQQKPAGCGFVCVVYVCRCVFNFFNYVYMLVPVQEYMHKVQVPMEARGGWWALWSWDCRLWTARLSVVTELWFSTRAASTFNCWVNSLAPPIDYKDKRGGK